MKYLLKKYWTVLIAFLIVVAFEFLLLTGYAIWIFSAVVGSLLFIETKKEVSSTKATLAILGIFCWPFYPPVSIAIFIFIAIAEILLLIAIQAFSSDNGEAL